MANTADMVAELHANIEPFKKDLSEAVGITTRTGVLIKGQLDRITGAFGSVKTAVSGLNGAISVFGKIGVAGFGLGAVVKLLGDTINGLAKIGEAADSIGITTTAFQEFAYAMSRAGIEESEQAKLLQEFAENADAASKGFGGLSEALGTYNKEAQAALLGTDDLQAQLGAVADAVRQAAGEQERAAIMTAAFGEANDDLRRFLINGASGIDATIDRARELGIAFDEELIRKAPEIKEKFEAMSAVISQQFQGAIVAAAPVIVTFAENLAYLLEQVVVPAIEGINSLSAGVRELVDSFRSVGDRSLNTLQSNLATVEQQIADVQKQITHGPDVMDWLTGTDRDEATLRQRLAELQAYRKEIQLAIAARGWQSSIVNTPAFRGRTPPDEPDDPIKEGNFTRAQGELTRIEQEYLKQTQQVTALARNEYDKRLADLDKLLEDQLISSADYVKARAELEATLTSRLAEEAQKQLKPVSDAISGTLTRAFDDFVQRGELNFKQMAASMIAELAKVQFQMAIIQPLFGGGSTQGGGLFGQMMAGVFHDGGVVGEGGRSRMVPGLAFAMAPRFHGGGVAGLRAGEVPAILERGETVIPKGGRGMGGRPIVFNITTPDADSFRRSEGQIAAMLTRATQRGQRNL